MALQRNASRHARLAVGTRPRTPWRAGVAGALVGGSIALGAFAPAHWLAGSVVDATGGALQLADVRGTVWRGSAQLSLTGGAGSTDAAALPGRVEWRLRPSLAGLRLAVNAACCTPVPLQVTVQPHWGGAAVRLADGRSQWPAAVLRGLGTPWNTLQPSGELAVSTRGLVARIARGRIAVDGTAELQARAMASRLSPLRPMGSYRLALAGGAAPTLQLDTLDGALQLNGSGRWVGGRLRFDGVASARPEHEAALANLLNIIGRRDGARSLITVG